jgi:pimeloyl-ACP methyl ester carboxylesterase
MAGIAIALEAPLRVDHCEEDPMKNLLLATLATLASLVAASASTQQQVGRPADPPFTLPADVEVRKAAILSDGTRLAADLYVRKGAQGKLPVIVLANGWGGTKANFRAEAAAFAEAGFLAVLFDYRGWGESDGRIVLAEAMPGEKQGGVFTAKVRELREVMDPSAELDDLANVIHWLQAEPQADPARLGIWGTSFGGGLAVVAAARDRRVKAVHAQMAPLELRGLDRLGRHDGTMRARGELAWPDPGLVVVSGLRGAPIAEHFLAFSPAAAMNLNPAYALQLVLAGKDELFDIRGSIAAYDAFEGTKNLVVLPDATHYDAYTRARAEVLKLALAWFERQLKP